ncbi:T9SS type A sorting domain-containing protein [bacterium]|nr:T9SS type A sorting domain-containing protein [bacterium]
MNKLPVFILAFFLFTYMPLFSLTCFGFRNYNLPPDFDGNMGAVACDIDRDGDEDIVSTAINDVIRIYINTGEDTTGDGCPEFVFENWRCSYNTPSPDSLADGIAVVDANGDDYPDLFVGTRRNWGHGGLDNVLLINDGTGYFYPDTLAIPRRGDRTGPVAAADLNGDGLDDIIVGNGVAGSDSAIVTERCYVLINSGERDIFGNYIFFDPADSAGYEDYVWSDSFCASDIVVADFDANGYKDIFFACGYSSCRLFYNMCSMPGAVPHFVDMTSLLPDTLRGNYNYRCAAASDFDADGDIDLIVSINNQATLLFFAEDSSFDEAEFPDDIYGFRRKIKVVDINGDGLPDILTADQIIGCFVNQPSSAGHFENLSTGIIEDNLPYEMFTVKDIALGDFDGDGDTDIFTGDEYEQNRLYINDGGVFAFATFSNYPADASDDYCVKAIDIDDDGDFDIFFGGRSDSIHFYENQGGIFIRKNHLIHNQGWTYGNNNRVRSFAFGDINHDGLKDFIVGGSTVPDLSHKCHIYINAGENEFHDSTGSNILTGEEVAVYDIFLLNANGDSLMDLFVASAEPASDALYINMGDTDGDGIDNFSLMSDAVPSLAGFSFFSDCRDINGDGIDDVLLSKSNILGKQGFLLIGEGDGHYEDITDSLLPPFTALVNYTMAARFGDVNGDGFWDILFVKSSQQNRLYIFDTTCGTYVDATDWLPSDSIFPDHDARFIDVDNDGDEDIVLVIRVDDVSFDRYLRHPRIYINDGTGHFYDSTEYYIPDIGTLSEHHWSVAVADFDNDTYADFITQADGQSRIWWNQFPEYVRIDGSGGTTPQDIRIHAYPNPFNRRVQIDVDGAKTPIYVRIYDLSGRLVFAGTVAGGKLIWTPGENMGSGIYIIRAGDYAAAKVFFLK